MKILRLFFRYAPRPLILAAGIGAAGGAVSAALMAVINVKLNRGRAGMGDASLTVFCVLVAVVLAANYGARALMLRLSTRSAADLRLSFCRQILALPLRSFEELGQNRFLATLTEDITGLCQALLKVPELCVNVSVVAGCLAYLAILSPPLALFLLLYLLMGIATTRLPEARAKRTLAQAREHADEMMRLFGALASGLKSLKLNAARRLAFVDDLLAGTVQTVRRLTFAGQHTYALSQSWGQVLYFLFIGAILYGFDGSHRVSQGVLIGYTLTVLYMRPPTIALLDMMPDFGRARVALAKIESLGLSLDTLHRTPQEGPVPVARGGGAANRGAAAGRPQRIELCGVTHRYYHEGAERQFELGPIDLAIAPGELLFLVGGNGSGKTTLAKLLTGLYRPERGEIRRGGAEVTAECWDDYRQDFAAVFTDFFLFDSLLGLKGSAGGGLDQEARRLLERLQLDHKVSVADGVLSTTALSQGQRKRLALLTAYLEDRPVYLFDEWAADQDPYFKKVFYTELLPRLKDAGKTVIVISHDDRYYPVADRIVKLEDGRISTLSAPPDEEHDGLAAAG